MTHEVWSQVDTWIEDTLLPPDPALAAALEASDAAGLRAINVAPNQGKLLMLLALMRGARRILEIGTLGGYSTIWLARALPADGRLVTLEFDPHHAEVAQANIARAGLADRVEVRVGPARATLAAMIAAGEASFDLVFIDADKPNNPHYLEAALALSHPGTVIVADNVVRDGRAADPASTDESVLGIRRFMERVAAEPRLVATAVQTVGSKGYDGFALALVV
ncbi:O-methyltransferase [Ancylobacter oerskovii]|uniref:O-methyltransferase n=1 Tax=Ancylobacter oerskovii TaxID=459519 RepID=A0ABW4YY84_9HYPH|nr:O-methyltransferase [Ancylobacter oerskovii]MBS7541723.1 O-methyltransferase [Ancylobacter oerskovii]